MFYKRLIPVFLALSITATCAGCAARQTPSPSPSPSPQGFTATPNNIAKNIQKSIMPPKQLAVLESNAEGIIIDAAKPDWSKVNTRVRQIRTSYNQLQPLMQTAAVPKNTTNALTAAVGSLEKQAAAKNAYETRVQANKITKCLADAADMFKMTIPSDLGRLGYYGREIGLNTDKSDWTAARSNFDSARTIWSSLRTTLDSTYSADAALFTTRLDNLGKSITDKNRATARTNAKAMLDGLAVLESDFAMQGVSK